MSSTRVTVVPGADPDHPQTDPTCGWLLGNHHRVLFGLKVEITPKPRQNPGHDDVSPLIPTATRSRISVRALLGARSGDGGKDGCHTRHPRRANHIDEIWGADSPDGGRSIGRMAMVACATCAHPVPSGLPLLPVVRHPGGSGDCRGRGAPGRHGAVRRPRRLHLARRAPRPREGQAPGRVVLRAPGRRHRAVRRPRRQAARRRHRRPVRRAGRPRGRRRAGRAGRRCGCRRRWPRFVERDRRRPADPRCASASTPARCSSARSPAPTTRRWATS